MSKKIMLSQGAGGKQMDDFIQKKITKFFKNKNNAEIPLSMMDDAAVIDDVVFTTDSHTIRPLIFPGGNLGSLSVCGTVNDIAVMGAKPLALSAGFIIEEGLAYNIFEKIVKSMGEYAEKSGVDIVTGDTKVVEKKAIQEFMINTSGIGKRTELLEENLRKLNQKRYTNYRWLTDSNLKKGDKIIISGNIGEHGIALMSFREGYGFETKVKSDVAPINSLVESALKVGGVVSAKDPTRGGLANTLNELSEKSKIGIKVFEDKIPMSKGVKSACDILGLDPLSIGNEGKVVLGVSPEKADEVLESIKNKRYGKKASIIGEVSDEIDGVILETSIGGKRNLDKPLGDPVPRIC
ncbi:MAG: hydrogenase expression/formation protein HypE [Candidatus Thermoplasmatota archaeon]